MSTAERSITVDLPVETVYNQWTQFEEFPRFMEGVEEVTQLDDTRLHWVANIGGQRREWEAKIIEQEPNSHIIWNGYGEADNRGEVYFAPQGNGTEVRVKLDFDPEGVVEQVGDKMGFVSGRVQGDLERFKQYIESRGQETGAWRGEIHGGQER